MFCKKGRYLFIHILTVIKKKIKEGFVSTADISLVGTLCPTQRGVPRISIDMVDRRIFLGLKFLISGVFFGKYFFG